MQDRNPYAAPQTNVRAATGRRGVRRGQDLLARRGRLGRVRYIGYSAGLGPVLLLSASWRRIAAVRSEQCALVVLGARLRRAASSSQILLTIQRSHDMNTTGWLSLVC